MEMANQEFKQEGRRQKPDSRSSTFALVRVLRPEVCTGQGDHGDASLKIVISSIGNSWVLYYN